MLIFRRINYICTASGTVTLIAGYAGTVESAVEYDSKFDLEQRKALSSMTRHSTWRVGQRCRVSLDIRPRRAESAVECDSTFDLEKWKALSSMTRHSTCNSGKRCRV